MVQPSFTSPPLPHAQRLWARPERMPHCRPITQLRAHICSSGPTRQRSRNKTLVFCNTQIKEKKMYSRGEGKRPRLEKRHPPGTESRATCQGITFHFPDMRLKPSRGEAGGLLLAAWVREPARDLLARRWEEHVVLIYMNAGV